QSPFQRKRAFINSWMPAKNWQRRSTSGHCSHPQNLSLSIRDHYRYDWQKPLNEMSARPGYARRERCLRGATVTPATVSGTVETLDEVRSMAWVREILAAVEFRGQPANQSSISVPHRSASPISASRRGSPFGCGDSLSFCATVRSRRNIE